MIISHENRYVFVELPLTGTTAIGTELRRNYGGVPVLKKHSTYETFRRQASAAEKDYFVFSCIRHPMDVAVSHYFKLRTDHFDFEDPDRIKSRSWLNRLIYRRLYLEQFRFIRDNDASFADYFLEYYRRPYSNWSVLSHKDMDYVIRFENLQDDFNTALKKMGIQPVRDMPTHNKTRTRDKSFADYYTDDCIPRAKAVFKCFMAEWGYEFPQGYGAVDVSASDRLQYNLLNFIRKIYWKRLKQSR